MTDVTHIRRPDGVRIGRWTGNRLSDGELEPRYGRRRESQEDRP